MNETNNLYLITDCVDSTLRKLYSAGKLSFKDLMIMVCQISETLSHIKLPQDHLHPYLLINPDTILTSKLPDGTVQYKLAMCYHKKEFSYQQYNTPKAENSLVDFSKSYVYALGTVVLDLIEKSTEDARLYSIHPYDLHKSSNSIFTSKKVAQIILSIMECDEEKRISMQNSLTNSSSFWKMSQKS